MLRVATRTSPAPATLLARLNLPRRGRVDALLDTLHKVQPGLDRLRRSFDDHIVGHSDIKEAFLLALLAREHLYIEGPPGVAKTMLSEIVSKATDLRPFIYQCHRDTRLNELVGESVIVRSTDAGGRETIRQDVVPGGVLACELAVLDDISRAPGEALNVLLRVLNERRWGGGPKLPLQTAIATGNPVADDGFYGDPLDPATLDRFTLQLRAQGLVQSADWAGCAEVIELYSGPRDVDHEPHVARCGPSLLRDASALVPMVVFPPACKRVLLRLLVLLVEGGNAEGGAAAPGLLLTDRTFLVKAVGVMKARAVLRGRHVCDPSDLRVVRYLTAFRVPEPLHLKIDEVIDRALAEEAEEEARGGSGDAGGSAAGLQSDSGGGGGGGSEDRISAAADGSSDGEEGGEGGGLSGEGGGSESQSESQSQSQREAGSAASPPGGEGKGGEAQGGEGQGGGRQGGAQQRNQREGGPGHGEENGMSGRGSGGGGAQKGGEEGAADSAHAPGGEEQAQANASRGGAAGEDKVRNLSPLLRRLRGHLERGAAAPVLSPSGAPRGWRAPPPGVPDLVESEPAEAALWCEAPSPRLPRRTRRHSPGAAGRVAIVRDTSSSMEGLWHRWAGLVCTSVVDLAKQHRMPVGYCEFSSSARKFLPADSRAHQRRRFFSREYAALAAHSGEAQSGGTTNFEAPLRTILEEFEAGLPRHRRRGAASPRGADQHVLFLTDGQGGDRTMRREIEEARGLGVAVHTIFIGNSRCPPVLDRLSEETGGTSWAAYFDVQSRSIRLVDRQAGEAAGLEASSPRPEQQKLDRLARVPALFNKYVEEKYGDAL